MNSRNLKPILLLIATLTFLTNVPDAHAKTEVSRIELPDRVLEAYIDSPAQKSSRPRPLLVLATAEDLEVNHQFYKKLIKAANREGFVTLRLQWSFQKTKGKPSADFTRESEELAIILSQVAGSRMMKHFDIDSTKVALIAHGLGARIAMLPAAEATPKNVQAMLVLNPICDQAEASFPKIYASFLSATYPRMLIASQGNTACPPAQIYSAGKELGENLSLYTLPGDAAFSGKGAKDKKIQDAVIVAANLWIQNLGWSTGTSPKASPKKPPVKIKSTPGHSAGTHP